MKCQCGPGGHKITGNEYVTHGACCQPGKVTRGCNCTDCERTRDASMTYKQRRRRVLGRRNAPPITWDVEPIGGNATCASAKS